MSQFILLASAASLVCFGIGIANQVDAPLGTLQALVGLCNILTASKFRLVTSMGKSQQITLESLPLQSKIHMGLVGVAVLLSVATLICDICRTRPPWSWARITGGLGTLIVVGVAGSATSINLLGALERLSVYSIQTWTFLLAIDTIYKTHSHNHFQDCRHPTKAKVY
jgi:hypothetical protein